MWATVTDTVYWDRSGTAPAHPPLVVTLVLVRVLGNVPLHALKLLLQVPRRLVVHVRDHLVQVWLFFLFGALQLAEYLRARLCIRGGGGRPGRGRARVTRRRRARGYVPFRMVSSKSSAK